MNPEAEPLNLDKQLDLTGIDPRSWEILDAYSLGGKAMAAIGAGLAGGLTRERVRQILKESFTQLEAACAPGGTLAGCLAFLEEEAGELWHLEEGDLTAAEAISRCASRFRAAGHTAEDTSVRQLILTVRLLAKYRSPKPTPLWPRFGLLACSLPKPVKQLPAYAALVERRRQRDRTWSSAELFVAVLAEAGEPLHWRVIMERASQMGRRPPIPKSTTRRTLSQTKEQFVRTGQGSYGLKAWGLQPAALYVDIIADILERAGEPLTYDQIKQQVDEIRPIKMSSLNWHLYDHPRFQKCGRRLFRLSSWNAEEQR